MTFTDDDLKQVKDENESHIDGWTALTCGQIRSLLCRLEAAEALILNNDRFLEESTPNLYDNWCKITVK